MAPGESTAPGHRLQVLLVQDLQQCLAGDLLQPEVDASFVTVSRLNRLMFWSMTCWKK